MWSSFLSTALDGVVLHRLHDSNFFFPALSASRPLSCLVTDTKFASRQVVTHLAEPVPAGQVFHRYGGFRLVREDDVLVLGKAVLPRLISAPLRLECQIPVLLKIVGAGRHQLWWLSRTDRASQAVVCCIGGRGRGGYGPFGGARPI